MKLRSLRIKTLFLSIFIAKVLVAQDSLSILTIAKNQLINDPWLQHASLALCVIDLKTNEKIVSYNESIALPTASTTKLFATASAFEMLGADFKPKTRIYGDQKIDANGVLKGNLWIRGGADISLGSRYYNSDGQEDGFLRKWIDSLYNSGLRVIEGDIIGDGSEYGYAGVPDGWNWSDMGNYYGAGPAGLSLYDNILRFYLQVGGKVGSPAVLLKVFPEIKELKFKSYIEAANTKWDNSYIYGAPYSYDRFGTGYLPKKSSSYMVKGTLPDPELQFAQEFYRICKEKGIQISGEAKGVRTMNLGYAPARYNQRILLLTHEGRSLNSIAWWTNRSSVNVFAETLVCWIAREKAGFGDTKSGVYLMEKYWSKKIDDAGLNLKDGSGLSRSNAITAMNFCSLLTYMYHSKNYSLFRETLPVAGESGTLSKVCYGQTAHGRVRAKSGTMNKVKSYAGYVETINGKELAFAIIANNYGCSNDGMLERFEKFMNAMAKY